MFLHKGSEFYDSLKDVAISFAKNKGDYNSRMAALIKMYTGKQGYETDFDAKMEKELVADLIGEYVFNDAEFVRSLSTQDQKLFQKIYEEIKYLCKAATAGSKEARQLEKVKKIFAEAYRDTKNTAPEDGVKYSIVALDNGNVYVKASRNVITGNTLSERRQNITDFFNDLLEGKPSLDIQTIEGDVLTITKAETANKARDNYREVNGKRVKFSDDAFAVKLHVESHIDEIAETSRSISRTDRKPDKKNHSFAKDGFTYRRAYFEDFDGQYYEITLSIGHNGSVATVYNVGKVKESVLPSAKTIAVVGSKALGKTPSSYSLSENDQNVNSKMSLSENTADTRADGKSIYGKDVALEETAAAADEQTQLDEALPAADPASVEADEQAVSEKAQPEEALPADDPAADAVNREQLERILGSKDSYTSENAGALYEELRNLKKGVRASNRLSNLSHGKCPAENMRTIWIVL